MIVAMTEGALAAAFLLVEIALAVHDVASVGEDLHDIDLVRDVAIGKLVVVVEGDEAVLYLGDLHAQWPVFRAEDDVAAQGKLVGIGDLGCLDGLDEGGIVSSVRFSRRYGERPLVARLHGDQLLFHGRKHLALPDDDLLGKAALDMGAEDDAAIVQRCHDMGLDPASSLQHVRPLPSIQFFNSA